MSSVIVKDMEMPDSCYHCKIAESCGHYIANYTNRRHPDCPLIAHPDHHGRLVDADALEKEGWSLHRTIRVDKNTEEYQTKPLKQVPTIEPRCETCEAFNKTRLLIPQPQQRWIPCSERLPSEGENVLLCDTLLGNVAIGKLIRYNTSCCWEVDHWDCDLEDWQAWMPLPEPYKEEGD